MEHMIIDFETLGVRETSLILQMAVVSFDFTTGEVGEKLILNFDIVDQILTRTIDQESIEWWKQQDERVTDNLIYKNDRSMCKIKDIIPTLNNFIRQNMAEKFCVWARGFLEPALIGSLKFQFKQKCLIDYWRWRDIRTQLKVQSPKYEKLSLSKHDAYNDCIKDINKLVGKVSNY